MRSYRPHPTRWNLASFASVDATIWPRLAAVEPCQPCQIGLGVPASKAPPRGISGQAALSD